MQYKPNRQDPDPEMQQPLLNPTTAEDPPAAVAASDPMMDAEAHQEVPAVAVATVIATEEEVNESIQDTAPEPKKS